MLLLKCCCCCNSAALRSSSLLWICRCCSWSFLFICKEASIIATRLLWLDFFSGETPFSERPPGAPLSPFFLFFFAAQPFHSFSPHILSSLSFCCFLFLWFFLSIWHSMIYSCKSLLYTSSRLQSHWPITNRSLCSFHKTTFLLSYLQSSSILPP